LRNFPTMRALAAADIDAVLRQWAGLGYYARARNLHAAAKQIVAHHGGEFPAQFADIAALPGVGQSTAGAVAAFAFGQRRAILDGNVKRVLSRYFALAGDPGAAATQARLWQIAESLLPRRRVADYHQALMDLGATVCARKPRCEACPLTADCRAYLTGEPAAYPAPRTRPARARRAVFMLVIRRRGHVLLVHRPAHGVWGGLWSLPEVARRAGASAAKPPSAAKSPAKPRPPTPAQRRRLQAWCARELGLSITVTAALPAFTHAFTHLALDIRPLIAECADAGTGGDTDTDTGSASMDGARHVWYNPQQPAPVGMPAAVRRILESIR